MRHRGDVEKEGNGEQLGATGLDPAGTGLGLTRGAVTIATRVEGETCGPTVVTRLPTPAQEGGTARRDRAQGQRLDPCEPMRVTIGVAMGTHDVGEAEGGDRGRRS